MSGTAWRIPLQANAQLAQPDTGKAMSLAAFMQQTQEHQQEVQRQNTLRQILGTPGAIDPTTGVPTPRTMGAVMAVDPNTGMKLQEHTLQLQGERAKAQKAQLDRYSDIQEAVSPLRTSALAAYQAALPQGPEAAQRAGQAVLDEGRPTLVNGGGLSPDEAKNVPTKFDYPTFSQRDKQWQDMQAKQRDETRKDVDLGLKIKKADQRSPGQAADDDVNAVAAAAVSEREAANRAAGTPPLSDAEKAKIRIDARNAAKPQNASVLSDDAANYVADRFLAGDKTATQGYGRSPANQTKIANAITERGKASGLSGADVARKMAEYQGSISAERTLGTRTANMEIAANEVKYMAPLALSASEKVNRTSYPTLNSILIAAERGTGNEDVVRFGLAANSLIYTYSKFLNPTGIPTDADKAKATDILSTAWSKGQFSTAIDQIKKEIASGQQGVASTKEEVGQGVSGAPSGRASSGASSPRAATDAGTKLPPPDSKGQYDLSKLSHADLDALVPTLPSGAMFVGPDGKTYRKP